MNIAFVPVRCGSKSIPFKNIKEFCGKPLVYWVLKSLENSKSIEKTYIATDCDKISKVVNSFGFKKVEVYLRDKANAEDTSSTESVMLEFLNKNNFDKNDKFILVQATSPLTLSSDFDNAMTLYGNTSADSLLTCVRSKVFIWNKDGTPTNYDYNKRPRRQDFGGVLIENGAFYISSIQNILESSNRLSGNISIYEMQEFQNIDIDEEDDWIIAEKLMKKHILKSESI